MIRTFRDRDTRRLAQREGCRKRGPSVERAALRKLRALHAATRLDDLRRFPGNRLEKLVGDRTGRYSIRVNQQWRLCFRWEDGDAFEVELVDYH